MWTTRVVVFYILTFVFTIILGGVQEAAGLSQTSIILPQWGPGLAGLAMLLVFRRDRLRITFFDCHVPASAPPARRSDPHRRRGADLSHLPVVLRPTVSRRRCGDALDPVAPVSAGRYRRRIGLARPSAQPADGDMVGLASSVIVGTLWAFWHVGSYQNGVLYTLFFMLLMISYTVVIYALLSRIGFNVLVAAIIHLMINIANLFSYAVVNRVDFLMVSSLVWAAIAIVGLLTRETAVRAGDERGNHMKAIVVYESHWGNTAAIARAIAEGIGPEARAPSTAEATGEALAGADLIVAGVPLLGFSLPTESMLKGLASNGAETQHPISPTHRCVPGSKRCPRAPVAWPASRRGSGGRPAARQKTILDKLRAAGDQPAAKPQRFVVQGKYGPLRDGELERAKSLGRGACAGKKRNTMNNDTRPPADDVVS